ncbi:hypothetical protein QVD17_26067 [Tagetes erecta]|uniref:F-box domain-containing protein n=1 Tax=Tagetes erecta TaxID=13708 RepID=A0AAD8K886_TARER|nr:hypothetical protein QVD17_26067 [Tagetes erecta]
MKATRRSKVQRLCVDRISTLPQTIIEIILCFLSIQEAARTSILSKEWRYKWTKIPKLVFDDSVVDSLESLGKVQMKAWNRHSSENMTSISKVFYAIYQVLLLRQAPIHEFTLDVVADCDCFELDQIILHLSRNHAVKKLKLKSEYEFRYRVPLSVFSMHHLTNLHLEYCDLDHKPTFRGFHSLRSLYLKYGTIPTKTLLHLLSNSPSLKSFTLLVEHWELGSKECTITELFACLHVVEHLTTWPLILGWFALDPLPKELPTLINLKYFYFKEMCFYCGQGLTFIAVMLKFSPNLEKIKIKTDSDEPYNPHDCCENDVIPPNTLEKYSDVWLKHLNELEIYYMFDTNVKSVLEFVKFILARSPKLKKVNILSVLEKDEEFQVLKDLLRAPRTSPVEIDVHD